jgi:MoxR-vWA-beta-propeller ternary system domain bpX4
MGRLSEFLDDLFESGCARLDQMPDASKAEREEAAPLLRRAFEDEMLDLSGPSLPFDESLAVFAAEWTRRACWFLMSRTEPGEVVEKALCLPPPPRYEGQDLAADLTFRYLPLLHRRARAFSPDDLLTERLTDVLRLWPLSGVLSDVAEEPIGPLSFGGHRGVLMLYTERWLRNPKKAWRPPEEYVELHAVHERHAPDLELSGA